MKVRNPIFWADVPDVDPIRVGDTFYMVSTSMHMMPGCPIMKSNDLNNWEIVNYVFDKLEDNDNHNLIDGKNIYGQGCWAASLKEHNSMFYVCFSANDMQRFYVYRTEDIENGQWQRTVIEGLFHDPALLFDEDRVFVIYGNGEIYIAELTPDASMLKPNGIHQLLFETDKEGIGLRCEGCHAYKIKDYYYLLFIDWPINGMRRAWCYRSTNLLGPYEKKVILYDQMGYKSHGVAQGGLFDAPDGKWYAVMFQDRDAVGRVPIAMPVHWIDDWPMLGIDGKAPEQFEVSLPVTPTSSIVQSDDFNYSANQLQLNWQWNHNPDNQLWSVTARQGHLRLTTGSLVHSVLQARNTLTQRTEGPACLGKTYMDTSNMKPGDFAGLVALQNWFGAVGVKLDKYGQRRVAMCLNDGTGLEREVEGIKLEGLSIYLKIVFNFEESRDQAQFFYSVDGNQWNVIGETLNMKYTLDHFMGYRIGLFNYATEEIGGYVDFDYFKYAKKVDGEFKEIYE